MIQAHLRVTVAALAILIAPSIARAGQKVAVLPASGVNIHAGYLDAARDILKDHLMSTGHFTVVTVPGAALDHEATPEEAVEAGRKAQADLALTTHIVHLGGTARVRITAYRTSDGSIAHTDSMTTAGGPDDLDPVLRRLAVAFAGGKPATQTADIETVTQKESDPYLKQTATRVFGLRLGAIIPFNRPAGDTETAAGMGLFWLYDARDFMAEIWGDFYVGDSAPNRINVFDIGLGGYYPFSRRNITPYVGAAAAWSSADFGGTGNSGLRVNPAVGMLVGRLWSVQFRGEVGYFVNLFSEYAEINTVRTARHYGHGPMFTLGLGL